MTKTHSGKGRKSKNSKDAEENKADSAVANVNNSHFDVSTSDNGIKKSRKEVMPVLKKQLMKKPLIKSKVVKVHSSAEVDAAENLKASATGLNLRKVKKLLAWNLKLDEELKMNLKAIRMKEMKLLTLNLIQRIMMLNLNLNWKVGKLTTIFQMRHFPTVNKHKIHKSAQ